VADNDDGHDSDEVMTSIQSIPYEEPLQMTAPIIRCKAWMNDPVGVSEYVWYLKLQSTWEAQSEKVILISSQEMVHHLLTMTFTTADRDDL